jgi:hypothetical protein
MQTVSLSTEFSVAEQDVYYTEILTLKGNKEYKCKLEIRSNSYQFQSYARAYVWSQEALKWNLVDDIAYTNMTTKEGLGYYPDVKKSGAKFLHFMADRDLLIQKLGTVLS